MIFAGLTDEEARACARAIHDLDTGDSDNVMMVVAELSRGPQVLFWPVRLQPRRQGNLYGPSGLMSYSPREDH